MNYREFFHRHHGVVVPSVLLLASHLVWSSNSGVVGVLVCVVLSGGALVYFKSARKVIDV